MKQNGAYISKEDALSFVGKGWHPLVSKLIDDLFELGWDGELIQIKEKFGGLRFYVGDASDEIHKRIVEAESESFRTCERCSRPGSSTSRGWIRTLCPTHDASDRVREFIEQAERRPDRLPGTSMAGQGTDGDSGEH